MELKLKEESWKNIFRCVRKSEIKNEGNFWAAIQHLESQLDEKTGTTIKNFNIEVNRPESVVKITKES